MCKVSGLSLDYKNECSKFVWQGLNSYTVTVKTISSSLLGKQLSVFGKKNIFHINITFIRIIGLKCLFVLVHTHIHIYHLYTDI